MNQIRIYGSLAGLGFLLALTPKIVLAEVKMPVSAGEQTSQFQKIEQPLSLKVAVALGGLGLIGAELWWFMFSGPSFEVSRNADRPVISLKQNLKKQK